jgi:hypothetical protein
VSIYGMDKIVITIENTRILVVAMISVCDDMPRDTIFPSHITEL